MNDLNRVMDALRKADKAGNVGDAKRLAEIAKTMSVPKPEAIPEQKSGGALPFMNRAIAATVGAPVDLITGGLNLMPGVDIKEPLGGRKSIEKGFGAVGVEYPEEGEKPDTYPEYIGQTLGEMAAVAIPVGKTAQAISKGSGVAANIAQTMTRAIAKHPYIAATSEVTGGIGSGVGRGAGEKNFQDNPFLKTTAEIVGGVSGGLIPNALGYAPTMMAYKQGKKLLQKVSLPFTEGGATYRAGKFIKGQAADPTKAATELAKDTIGDLPPAVAAGEKRLLSLYKSFVGQDPATDGDTIEALSKSIVSLEKEMRKIGYGSPDLLAEITEKRIAAIELSIDERILKTMESAQSKLDALPVAQRRVNESRIVRNELESVMKEEQRKNRKLWEDVPKDTEVSVENTRKEFAKITEDLSQAQMVDIPRPLRKNDIINGKKKATYKNRDNVDIGRDTTEKFDAMQQEVNNTRTRGVTQGQVGKQGETIGFSADSPMWMRDLPKDKNGKVYSRARLNAVFNNVRNRKVLTEDQNILFTHLSDAAEKYAGDSGEFITNPLSKIGLQGDTSTIKEMQGLRSKLLETARMARKDGEWNKARIASNMADAILDDMGIDVFGATTPEAKALQTAIAATKQFKSRFESGVVGKILGYGKSGAPAIDPDLTLDISIGRMGQKGSIDLEKVAITPDAIEATKKYIARSFTDFSTDKTGKINPLAAEKWVRNNEAILDKLPGMQKELTDIGQAQKLADRTKIRMDARKKALRNPKISESAKFLNAVDLNVTVDSILKSKNPSRTAFELSKQAKKDPTGAAMEGLRAGFIDSILEKSSVGAFNELGEQTLSGRTLLNFVNRSDLALKHIFTPEQITRMKQVGKELSKIESYWKASLKKPEIDMDDPASNMLQLASRVGGVKFGSFVSKLMGGGGSIQVPGIFSERFKKFAKGLSVNRASQLVHDAIISKDPELLKALMLPINKPKLKRTANNIKILDRQINLWLAGTGQRVYQNIVDEEQEKN